MSPKNPDQNTNLITPELVMRNRFGHTFNELISQIPTHAILSFFSNSISIVEKLYPPTVKINWIGNQAQLILFKYNNRPLCLVTLPFGASLASMVVEELIYSGVKFFISIGFAGSISQRVKPYDLVIPTKSIKEEGVAELYLPKNTDAQSSKTLIESIETILQQSKTVYHKGINWSISTPYRETYEKIARYQKENVLCVDMESASLFAVAQYHKVNLASLFSISDSLEQGIWTPHFKDKRCKIMKKKLLEIALKTLLLH